MSVIVRLYLIAPATCPTRRLAIIICLQDFDTLIGNGNWFGVPVTSQTLAGQKSKRILG